MKKMTDVTFRVLATIALKSAKREVNSTCIFLGYQPKMPKKVHELKAKK